MTVADIVEFLLALPQQAEVVMEDRDFGKSGDFVSMRTVFYRAQAQFKQREKAA